MNDLRMRVKEADVVSFDLFDTLVVRNVSRPVDAFRLAQEMFNVRTKWYLTAEVGPIRVASEMELRAEAVQEGKSADSVTLEAIYRRFGEHAQLPPEMVDGLMANELEVERRLLRPVERIVDLVNFAIDQGKPVLIVSDTYLPGDFLNTVVLSAGVLPGFELLTSSESGRSKADGSLWATVVDRFSDRRILHFGDNGVSDGTQARAFGIETCELPSPSMLLERQVGPAAVLNGPLIFHHLAVDKLRLKNVHRSMVNALIGQKLAAWPDSTDAYACGYGAFGPMLAGFVQWLHHSATQAGNDELFFLARDGHVMKQAYEAMWGADALPTTYMLASRRLLNLPAIGSTLTNLDVDFLMQTSVEMKVGSYFERLGIPEVADAARPILRSLGLDPLAPAGPLYNEVRACFWRLERELVAAAARERTVLLDYWKEVGFLTAKRPGIVDIGWHGSLQRSVQRILDTVDDPPRVVGHYFGLHATRGPDSDDRPMHTYIDGALKDDAKLHRDLILNTVAVLEFCFTRPEGTVVGIAKDPDGDRRSIRAPDTMSDLDSGVLVEIQRGAVDFVTDLARAGAELPSTVSMIERDVATENMVMVVNFPYPRAAEVLGRRGHADSFGAGVEWTTIGAPTREPSVYREHPDLLREDLAASYWKAGFLKNAAGMGLSVD